MSLFPLAELVPHSGDMVLLDEVVRYGVDEVETRVQVKADGLFNQEDGSLPAWLGVELMAQSIAAFAGCHAREAGKPIALGFLLGTRKFECNVESFPLGAELHIKALRSLQDDNGMAVFECHLTGPDIHATARLNVFQPPNAAQFLEESGEAEKHV
ncbi:hotdog family protein [Pseudomonas sp. M30-35]|uniref:ApeP family dehydratase n=1 Tax=Pseudomonas sp. M30-35 TaxID=1981174 RepID=UPI000B3C6256|nr:hotdog family protein [Pseudomonas sp. M30-35]ARU90096.1 3-hydroxylacyl-ACP dehydratase [Pseudomonas sp. M30-35]